MVLLPKRLLSLADPPSQIWASPSHSFDRSVRLLCSLPFLQECIVLDLIPLHTQHGGIPTFLRFRNLSASSPAVYAPFYDVNGTVFGDFKLYIETLLLHKSNITGVSSTSLRLCNTF